MSRTWLAALLAAASLPAQAACGDTLSQPGRAVIAADGLQLAHAPSVWPLPVGEPFGLDIELCGTAAPLLQVDADMPAHRHGMNYRASVTPGSAPGRYVIEGLMLHMPGRWRFSFDLGGATPQRLTHEVEVP
jgi:hypothetical protein